MFDQNYFIILGKYVLLFTDFLPSNHAESDKTTDVCRCQIVRVTVDVRPTDPMPCC